jgi:hypothetical protein
MWKSWHNRKAEGTYLFFLTCYVNPRPRVEIPYEKNHGTIFLIETLTVLKLPVNIFSTNICAWIIKHSIYCRLTPEHGEVVLLDDEGLELFPRHLLDRLPPSAAAERQRQRHRHQTQHPQGRHRDSSSLSQQQKNSSFKSQSFLLLHLDAMHFTPWWLYKRGRRRRT